MLETLKRIRNGTSRPRVALAAAVAISLVLFPFLYYRARSFKPVRIGVDQAPPYQAIGSDGRVYGVSVDMLGEAARRLGIAVTWVPTRQQPGQALFTGTADIWPAVARTPERERSFHFTDPWIRNNYCLVSLRGATAGGKLAESKPLAYLDNAVHRLLIGRAYPQNPKIVKRTRAEILHAVCDGEAAAGFMEMRFLDSVLLERPPGCETAALDVFIVRSAQRDLAIMARREFGREADAIRAEINQLARNGEMAASLDRWSPFSSTETQSIFALQQTREFTRWMEYGVALLLLILLIGLWQSGRTWIAERRYRELFELNPFPSWVYDVDTLCFVDVNQAAIDRYGYSREEFLRMKISDIRPAEDVTKLKVNLDEASGRRQQSGPWRHLKKDGSLMWVEVTSHDIVSARGPTRLVIADDVTERKRQREELEQAKDAAEVAMRAKSTFLANMSHEIRTPMNGVIGMTALLLDTELTPEQHQFAETIRSSGEALLEVINDILDFSKIEAGKLHLERIPFDLQNVCDECVDLIAVEARRKQLVVETRFDGAAPETVLGDPVRIRQILLNLLSNAVKFTESGSIGLELKTEDIEGGRCMVQCAVTDTGIGIAPEAQERLFQSFTQADSSTTRQFGGTGLGLSICKGLVELMGGTIGFDSEPGRGSRFWFNLTMEVGPEGKFGGIRQRLEGGRVLIVDDSTVQRDIVRHLLERVNAEADEAASGEEAVSKALQAAAEGAPYALAILDFHMPTMDGLETARKIRGNPLIASLPIVMVGSYRDAESAEEARQLGIAGFLLKPMRRSYLIDAINRALDTSALPPIADTEGDRSLASKEVLLVEDNPANQTLALMILKRFGCKTDVAQNGREALEAWQAKRYDLILMDCQMPEMDGFTATSEIRRQESSGRRTPIVALTANALEEERQKCFDAGMDDHLAKPFRRSDLKRMLEKWSGPPPED